MTAPTTLQAIILGLVQGITEFLPISSTAHLRIIPALLGWPDPGAAFTAVCQFGTLAATFVYFWKDLTELAKGMVKALTDGKPMENQESRLAMGIIIGTIPISVLGLAFKKQIEGELRSLYVIAAAMFLVAIVMGIAEKTARHRRGFTEMTFMDAFLIGCGQTFALIPGASRSGSTITTGLFLGLKRETAARFSFILGIPAVFGAGVLELHKVVKNHSLQHGLLMPTLIATVVAFISGIFVIGALLRFLQRQSTMSFVVYRIILGTALIALVATHYLKPNEGADEPAGRNEPVAAIRPAQ